MTDHAASFDELYRTTSRRLMQFAYAMAGDLSTAQDLTQEAYIRAWRDWRHVSSLDRPEIWLRVVVSRLATDRWRKLRTAARKAPREVRHSPPPSEDSVLLVGALRRLPLPQRRAICLFYLLDMSIAEIAVEDSVAEGTVKSWLSRGRAALAEILGPNVFHDQPGDLDLEAPDARL